MTLTFLIDNPQSWIVPHTMRFVAELQSAGHTVHLVHHQEDVLPGDCCFLLSCERIVPTTILARNAHNLVVHESALPEGRGWSPLTHQILEGKKNVPITLFEAAPELDSGPIYEQDIMRFEGHELVDEIRSIQAEKTFALIRRFLAVYPAVTARPQRGSPTFYPRRRPGASELNPDKTIADQFELLRVVDNDRYPAFFRFRGHRYLITVYKAPED